MKDVMFDLETLGRKPGCIILSIGAAFFEPGGNGYGDKFYINIDVNSSRAIGLVDDPDTVNWWVGQPEEAKRAVQVDPHTVQNALYFFANWFKMTEAQRIWCQGLDFDIPILKEAFSLVGIKEPWEYWNVRDTRTAYDLCGFDYRSIKRNGVYHHALDDALHQIYCLQTAISQRHATLAQVPTK